MATITVRAIAPAKSKNGEIRVLHGPEAASQTFLLGAPLAWSSGYIQEAGADPSAILGIAAEAGHNNAANGGATIAFYPLEGTIFEANLAQAAASTTSAATNLGTLYGIVKRSTGTVHWVVDSSDTSNTRVRLLGFALPSVVTDVNARVYCTFLNANDALSA